MLSDILGSLVLGVFVVFVYYIIQTVYQKSRPIHFDRPFSDGSLQLVEGFAGTGNNQFLETDDALSVTIDYEGSEISLKIVVPDDI